ncbi:MAG: serine/threonine-protein kinase [Isosphaeraceae bacterium]
MARFERPKSADSVPHDLLPVIRDSGIMSERQIAELRAKVVRGEYPLDSRELAERLVRDQVITAYQAKRFLGNRSHGLIVGRYVILDRIGSGSMGRVYKAHHVMMDRVVALKIISPEIASNERVVARFQREMKLVGRLDHPNVVRAFDADQVQRVLYIVMEYVPGYSLGERLKKGPIPAAEMIEYAAQAAQGLAHAHEQGIVHRDIKPSNILLNREGRIKILDLGLGVLMEGDTSATFATADGITVGTVDYMSPEQACGREVDGRSDVYGLGCAMYHLMAGKLPFPGSSPIERLGKRISGRHVPITEYLPDLPPAVVRVMDRMMAHKPHERYANAAEAAEALRALLRPRSGSGRSKAADSRDGSGTAGTRPASDPSAPSSTTLLSAEPAAGSPSPPEPTIIHVQPNYPRWFAPAARFAETQPGLALATAIVAAWLTFAAGFLVGFVMK